MNPLQDRSDGELDAIVAIFAVDQREWSDDERRIYDEAGRWREGQNAVYRHRAAKIRALVAEQCAVALEALDPIDAALAGQHAFGDAAEHLRRHFSVPVYPTPTGLEDQTAATED